MSETHLDLAQEVQLEGQNVAWMPIIKFSLQQQRAQTNQYGRIQNN